MTFSVLSPASLQVVEANGARIPAMGLGTWQSTHDAGVGAVRAALDAGYRHIDTAARYQNEQAVGQALSACGVPRGEVFVTTKVWHTELRAPDFRRAAEASVARLGLDHVDLLLVHWPNPEVPLDETIGALCDAQLRGLTRFIGVSNFPVALLDRAVALSSLPLVANQCEYHPYLDQTKLLAACSRHGMALISHSPLGSGKLLADPVIAEIARQHDKKPAQIILRWLIQQTGVAAIPKSSNPVRIGENLAIFDFELDAASMARISALARADGRVSKPVWHPEWDVPETSLRAAMNSIDTIMNPAIALLSEAILATDRRHFMHPGTHASDHASGELEGRLMRRASDIRIEDHAGRSYIDGFAGLYCVNIGYGREEMAEAIAAQTRKLSFYHTYAGFSNDPAVELSQRLIEDWSPPGMKKVFYGMSGSDANETQVKLVWYYNNVLGRPRKKKIIARHRSYHGSGIATGSLTGQAKFHAAFDLPMPQVLHTACPDFYRDARPGDSEAAFVADCVGQLERLIDSEGADTIAAFFGEPVMGSGGILPPPAGYWPAIQAVLKRHDILFVADEVVCGFGRLGSRNGSEHYGIEPDLISVAKGLTSGYLPLSGVIVGERVWDVIERGSREQGAMSHGWTYSGHPVCAAAALVNLDILEREQLVRNAADVGAYLLESLHAAFDDHPLVGNVRGAGMLAALELMADKTGRTPFAPALKVSNRVAQAALARGLIVRSLGINDIIGFAPPLVATRADIDEIVGITRQALDAASEGLPVPA